MKPWESSLEHSLWVGIHLRNAHQSIFRAEDECVGGGEHRILERNLLSGSHLVVRCEILFTIKLVPAIRGYRIVRQIPDQKITSRQFVENGSRKVILPNEIACANRKLLRSYFTSSNVSVLDGTCDANTTRPARTMTAPAHKLGPEVRGSSFGWSPTGKNVSPRIATETTAST